MTTIGDFLVEKMQNMHLSAQENSIHISHFFPFVFHVIHFSRYTLADFENQLHASIPKNPTVTD